LFGYDTRVISGAILLIRPAFGLGTSQDELVVSAVLIGPTLGAIASARVTDTLGRRAVLLVAASSFAVGAIGSALAPNPTALVLAHLLIGAAIGVASYAVPHWYFGALSSKRPRLAAISESTRHHCWDRVLLWCRPRIFRERRASMDGRACGGTGDIAVCRCRAAT
jgi:MFS family permease